MRLHAGSLLLLLITVILVIFLLHRGWFDDTLFPPRPDAIYPRPIVELYLRQNGEFVFAGNVLTMESAQDDVKLIVKLRNNSSEPSIRGTFAAGVLVVLRGAKVEDYELGGFSGIIGVNEDGDIINVMNSSIVEFFVDKIDPWQSIAAELHIVVEDGSDCILIAYRGWIIDEDDVVVEPISDIREHYIARFPVEEYLDNPPDSRWAGRNFMRYKLHNATICFNR